MLTNLTGWLDFIWKGTVHMKLTKPQKALLSRELILDHGEPFITLCDVNEDRVAKALSSKGFV